MDPNLASISKLLSLVLRHQPEALGLLLDEQGWVDVDVLIRQASAHGSPITHELLRQVVAENDKQRFAFSADGLRIRANQGHSVAVDLDLKPMQPPAELFHGTATRFVDSIRAQGLRPGSRQHVHLSADVDTAIRVGQRHGKPTVLRIKAGPMADDGHTFYRSANGVWLVAAVPVTFIEFPPQ